MNIKPQDIEISLIQADHEHNLGNWSLQTYSGTVLYHKPTGIQVRCTEHKSQWKNKAAAMEVLLVKVEYYDTTNNDKYILKLLADLKVSLGKYENLTLEEYDILYGDVEEIQYKVFERFNND